MWFIAHKFAEAIIFIAALARAMLLKPAWRPVPPELFIADDAATDWPTYAPVPVREPFKESFHVPSYCCVNM
jgi:hypothetical protein